MRLLATICYYIHFRISEQIVYLPRYIFSYFKVKDKTHYKIGLLFCEKNKTPEHNRIAIECNRIAIECNRISIECNRMLIEHYRMAIEYNRIFQSFSNSN